MLTKTDVIFWLEYPLMHMEPLIKELSKTKKVSVVYENELPQYRKDMGFSRPEFNALIECFLSKDVYKLIKSKGVDCVLGNNTCVHVFHGFSYCKFNYKIFKILCDTNQKVFVQVEAPFHKRNLHSFARLIRYKYLAMRWKNRIEGLLAFGKIGLNYYLKAGFSPERVFEFGYFGAPKNDKNLSPNYISSESVSGVNFVFIGRLNKIKNVSFAIKAIARMVSEQNQQHIRLTIYGDGEERTRLEALTRSLNISDNVTFAGYRSNSEILNSFNGGEICILPSLSDGWGYVVNEALSNGAGVVVSDSCGVSCVAQKLSAVSAFQLSNLESFVEATNNLLINMNRSTVNDRQQEYLNTLSEHAGVMYFEQVTSKVESTQSKLCPPWR